MSDGEVSFVEAVLLDRTELHHLVRLGLNDQRHRGTYVEPRSRAIDQTPGGASDETPPISSPAQSVCPQGQNFSALLFGGHAAGPSPQEIAMTIFLNRDEIAQLDRRRPETKSRGGWQLLIVTLSQSVDRSTGRLVLDGLTMDRIRKYAFEYRNGGWQARLRRVFGRTLGPNLDGGRSLRPAA